MISFYIPFRLPSLNEYINRCRCNKYGGAKFKKDIEDKIMWILNTRHFLIASPVHVTFIWHESSQRRDKDNVAFAKKFILDALHGVELGIFDNTDKLRVLIDEIRIDLK